MLDREHLLSQIIAVFCLIFGALVCAYGCHSGQQYEALKTLGAGIAGAGIQAFTSQMRQNVKAAEGATVNVDSPTT